MHVILKSAQSTAYSCVYVQFDLLCAARVHVHERENNFKGADQEAGQSLQEEGPEQGRPGGDSGEWRLLGWKTSLQHELAEQEDLKSQSINHKDEGSCLSESAVNELNSMSSGVIYYEGIIWLMQKVHDAPQSI